MTLLELTKLSQKIELLSLESQGEVTDELAILLDISEQNLPQKVDSIKFILDNLESSAEFFKAKSDEYKKAQKTQEKTIEWLTNYIEFCMKNSNSEVILGNETVCKLVKNPHSVEIIDENLIPQDYKVIVQETKIDKKKILECLKLGLTVEGAELKQSERVKFSIKKD